MKTRVISAIVAIALCIPILIFSDMATIVAIIPIALVNTLLCGEFLSARQLQKQPVIFIPSLLFALTMPLFITTISKFIPFYLYAIVLFVLTVVFHETIDLSDIMFAFAGVVLITFSMSGLVYISCNTADFTSFWLVLTLAVPWAADSTAYFVGSAIGKHKLCPVISPKKSVEGAVAGVIGGVLASVIVGLLYQFIFYRNVSINFFFLIIIGLVNAVLSIFGDLIFSIIKRKCDIKDYGIIMPGHGGMLDRFDSVIFCAPTLYLFSQFMTIITFS